MTKMNLDQKDFACVMFSPVFIVYGYLGYVRGYSYYKLLKFSGGSNFVSYIVLIIGIVLVLNFFKKVFLFYRDFKIFKSLIISRYFLFLLLSLISVNILHKMNMDLYFISYFLSLFSTFSTGRMFRKIIELPENTIKNSDKDGN